MKTRIEGIITFKTMARGGLSQMGETHAALSKMPTWRVRIQSNHFFAAINGVFKAMTSLKASFCERQALGAKQL